MIETVARPLGASLPEIMFDSFGRPVSRFVVLASAFGLPLPIPDEPGWPVLHPLPQVRVQIVVALVRCQAAACPGVRRGKTKHPSD